MNMFSQIADAHRVADTVGPDGDCFLRGPYGGSGISQLPDLLGRTVTDADEPPPSPYSIFRLRAVTKPAGGTTTFTYDSVGRLTKASDTASGAGTIDFGYDTLDRLIQETTGQGTVSYQYDVLGRRTNMVANGQQPVTYGYDAASRLTQVSKGSLAVGLGYDTANRRTSLTYPNGTSTSYGYDVASRLTNINHLGPSGIIEALTYQYDPAGNRTRLTRSNGTASVLPRAVASATYDPANEQTAFAGVTLQYDANGNLTNDGTSTYVWDARNRLVGISGGATASFSYDPLGRRVSKTIGGVTTQFAYDGNDIVQDLGSGAVATSYLRSLNIDELFGILRQDGVYFSIHDGLGSTLALSNQAASSVVQYSYEPFGKTTSSNPSFINPFQFTGRENDGTGFYYYRARYYSTSLQRFIGADPLGLYGGDINFYAYVGNNPTTFVDLDGLAKDRSRRPGQEGGRGPLSGSDHIIQDGKEIARKEGGAKGAEHIRKEMERLKLEGNLSNERALKLRGAAKILKELGDLAKTGVKIGGLAIGILLELADPAEAGQGSGILPEEAESSRKK